MALATACQSVLGIEDLPRGELPAPSGALDGGADGTAPTPISYTSPDCALCVAEACGVEEAACRGGVTCSRAYACLAACAVDDPACRAACEDRDPVATADGTPFASLDACSRRACTAACYGGRGIVSAFAGATCGACVDSKCETEEAACIASGGCERVFACATKETPLNPDRVVDCLYRWPVAKEVDALSGCYQACGAPCPFGHDFRCASAFTWQTGHAVVEHVVGFSKFPNKQPAVGLTVSACDVNDCESCTFPIATTTTDAQGEARLTLAVGVLGFRGCLYVTGPGYLTNLYYFGRPITRPEGNFHISIGEASLLTLVEKGLGIPVDPERGHVGVDIWDCLFEHARGISFTLSTADAATTPYYSVGSQVSLTATATDASGNGGFLNVPPGDFVVTARDETGKLVAQGKGRALAHAITGVSLFPEAIP